MDRATINDVASAAEEVANDFDCAGTAEADRVAAAFRKFAAYLHAKLADDEE